MKNLKSILFATAFMIASLGFANTDDSTPISGNYNGTLETKTFLESEKSPKATSKTDYGIDFLFNGNVFIYQGLNAKAMGTYTLEGDNIVFEVNSHKGDSEFIDALFRNDFKYSKSGGQLMLISNSEETSDVRIVRLTKQKN